MKKQVKLSMLIALSLAIVALVGLFTVSAFAADADKYCRTGDIDGDGNITASDARLALRRSVGLESFDADTDSIADFNRDNEITSADARTILRIAVDLDARPLHVFEVYTAPDAQPGCTYERCTLCHFVAVVKNVGCPAYDINNDGIISSADARLALRAAVGLSELNATEQKRADADRNGVIAAADARIILRAAVGLDALPAHTYADWTYTDADSHSAVCEYCGDVKTAPHTPAALEAKPATCTATGLTSGTYCADCGGVLTAQQTVPALGHNYTSQVIAATLTKHGYTEYTCSRCADKYTDSDTPAFLTRTADKSNEWMARENYSELANAKYSEASLNFAVSADSSLIDNTYDVLNLTTAFKGYIYKIVNYCMDKAGRVESLYVGDVAVYENGKFVNAGIKKVLFNEFSGIFTSLSGLDADNTNVISLDVTADVGYGKESFTFTADMTGDKLDNVAAVSKKLADRITVVNDGDVTTVTVDVPDSVIAKADEKLAGYDTSVRDILNNYTVGDVLNKARLFDYDSMLTPSQLAYVNKALEKANNNTDIINSALDRVTSLTTLNSTDVLSGKDFTVASDIRELVKVIASLLSDDVKDMNFTDFYQGNGNIVVPVSATVVTDSAKLHTEGTVNETIILVLHVNENLFDVVS